MLGNLAASVQDLMVLFVFSFYGLLLFQEVKRRYNQATGLFAERSRSLKTLNAYLVYTLGLILVISLFQSGISNTAAFANLGIFGNLLRKIESQKVLILTIGNLIFAVIFLPTVFAKIKRKGIVSVALIPFLVFVNLRTIFQDRDIDFDFYTEQIAVATTLLIIGIASTFTDRSVLLFLGKIFINSIVLTSFVLYLIQPSSVVTSSFGGGIGFNERFVGICVTPTLFAGVTSLSFVINIFDFKSRKNFVSFLLSTISLISTILTGSRTGIIACLVAFVLYAFNSSILNLNVNFKRFLLYVLFSAPPMFILSGFTFSALEPRTVVYKAGLQSLTKAGFWGLGPLNLTQGDDLRISYLHNQLLQTTLEFGVAGLLLFVIFALKWLNKVELVSSNMNFCIAIWVLLFMATENPLRVHTPLFATITVITLIAMRISIIHQIAEKKLVSSPFNKETF